ncbi:MAG TPA: glutathione S-transferase N-terminal domain-containing protein [Vineibacter sp.]|nr:glutathione S-transferase N-terminal domain-containing protein [Vineibacter sp.]
MIELHTWSTQNARKVSIMLEECELPYRIHPVNLFENRQKDADFRAINPNGRIPALVDPDGPQGRVVVAESGAILIYLAEKAGRFLPISGPERYRVLHWLMWQMSGVGPTFGNLAHFVAAIDPKSPRVNAYLRATMAPEIYAYPIKRFNEEALRLVSVMETVLEGQDYMAGDLSIADFAAYAWFESIWPGFRARQPSIDDDRPNTAAWMARLAARPHLQRGMERLAWGVDLDAGETSRREVAS